MLEDSRATDTTGQAPSAEAVGSEDAPVCMPSPSESTPEPADHAAIESPSINIMDEPIKVSANPVAADIRTTDEMAVASAVDGTAVAVEAEEEADTVAAEQTAGAIAAEETVVANAAQEAVPAATAANAAEEAVIAPAADGTSGTVVAESKVQRIGFTLDIIPEKLQEYIEHHEKSPPEVAEALRSIGIRNLSLWAWQNRLFYYAEYVGTMPLAEAMDKYATKPGVKEWEDLMHSYQVKIPGTEPSSDVWWQPCKQVYHQS